MSKKDKKQILVETMADDTDQMTEEQASETAPVPVMGDDNRKHITLNYKGFEFDFAPVRLHDQRVLYLIGKLQTSKDVNEQMKLQSRFFDVILGEDAFDVMDGVAEVSGGFLDQASFSEFVVYLMEQAQVKN